MHEYRKQGETGSMNDLEELGILTTVSAHLWPISPSMSPTLNCAFISRLLLFLYYLYVMD